jgi:lysophospholipase L1-like esterase
VAPGTAGVDLPRAEDLELGASLPTGDNPPQRYLAFGDSITAGDGSSDGQGYLPGLASALRAHFGAGELVNGGDPGTKSWQGAERIASELERVEPAWLLVHYGTNDWNHCDDVPTCPTIDSLRSIVRQARAAHTLPVLATVIPSNTGFVEDDGGTKAPPERNVFVAEQGRRIRELAHEEGVALADLEAAFLAEAAGDLSRLFVDHVHPNDRGYAIMTRELFRALSTPAAGLRPDNPAGATPARILSPPPRRSGKAFEDDD